MGDQVQEITEAMGCVAYASRQATEAARDGDHQSLRLWIAMIVKAATAARKSLGE